MHSLRKRVSGKIRPFVLKETCDNIRKRVILKKIYKTKQNKTKKSKQNKKRKQKQKQNKQTTKKKKKKKNRTPQNVALKYQNPKCDFETASLSFLLNRLLSIVHAPCSVI